MLHSYFLLSYNFMDFSYETWSMTLIIVDLISTDLHAIALINKGQKPKGTLPLILSELEVALVVVIIRTNNLIN